LTKGDLALSISLTSVSTVLSLIFTPLLLSLYCSNVPNVVIPVALIVQTIVVLVIIPLAIGMSVRAKWPNFAQKSTKVFSILGLVALLFLIVAGIMSNLGVFKEFERYGGAALAALLLAVCALVLGMLSAKLVGANNSQNRAMTFQTLIRNVSLSMAIALLIQDIMGDFYSAMFVTAAFYGIAMYLVGALAIVIYKKMPVEQ
jgi:BASS family bile acid:Na+ symporter